MSEKLAEHYGITLPCCAAATLTERHARALSSKDVIPPALGKVAPLTLIAETDGSMIPVVETGGKITDPNADRRKQRTLFWKEARLSLVRRPDEVEPIFAVTIGEASIAGQALKGLADAAGLTRHTHVHGVGDGAPWIAEQMETQFGTQGTYLIDLFHLCEYLAATAPICDPEHPKGWLDRQKEAAKEGQIGAVMAALASHLEPDTVDNEHAPVRRCHRYIANRPGQFNYHDAIAAGLPIGSGEVESAHRYVIQDRIKLPGAWWRLDNAEAMLKLRVLRANHLWNDYWKHHAAA